MKLYVFAITLGLMAVALPTEAGPDGFGRCELKEEAYTEDISLPTNLECYWAGQDGFGRCELKEEAIAEDLYAPTGFECYWSGPGPGPYPCWVTYTTLAGSEPIPDVDVPTGIDCGY